MRASQFIAVAAAVLLGNVCATLVPARMEARAFEWVVKPKIFIISMFGPEGETWYDIPEFDILVGLAVMSDNVVAPRLRLMPTHCTTSRM